MISFDPFDDYKRVGSIERLPFAVSGDCSGWTNFTFNKRYPGCSTLHHYNYADLLDPTWPAWLRDGCMRPKRDHLLETRKVRAVRLSDVIKARNITRIWYLKVDAQGADFSIIRDMFENVDLERLDVR